MVVVHYKLRDLEECEDGWVSLVQFPLMDVDEHINKGSASITMDTFFYSSMCRGL